MAAARRRPRQQAGRRLVCRKARAFHPPRLVAAASLLAHKAAAP